MQGVLKHLRLSRPSMRPFNFLNFVHTTPAHMEKSGFKGATTFDIWSAKGKSADGFRLWSLVDDTLSDAIRGMTQQNLGAFAIMKPREKKSPAGIIAEKEAQAQRPGLMLRGRSLLPQEAARKFSFTILSSRQFRRYESSTTSSNGGDGHGLTGEGDPISLAEAKKLMRLVNVESLKIKLGLEGQEVISYTELLKACESMGVCRSLDEAASFAKVLDEAGVVLLFRDKVYLHPDKVVDLIRRSVPLALTAEDDPRKEELKNLQERKEEIDRLAQRQVRRVLWSGLGVAIVQVGLFFRLTFWEFSWDVMEPIAFFSTTTGIVIGYAYFLFTSKDPTYQDLMERLFISRQRKLFKKHQFDVSRFAELQDKCKSPLDKLATYKKAPKKMVLEDA